MKPIRHTSQFGRMSEHGRIRTGDKTPKGAPRALTAFRFTSPDRGAIEALAGQHGGIPTEWVEPRAAVQGQWQVLTEASEIPVLLPEDALSTAYELWAGSGCQRRCDGEVCVLPNVGPDGDDEEAPCLCAAQNVMKCQPKVRLNVALPDIEFRGAWRLESSSWAAAEEMSGIEPLLQQVQARGIQKARLVLERRSKMTSAGKRNFVVPRLVLAASLEEIASGRAGLLGIPVRSEQQALGTGKIEEGEDSGDGRAEQQSGDALPGSKTPVLGEGFSTSPSSLDDEILDAELVEDDMTDPTAGMTDDEKAWETSLDLLEVKTQLDRKVLVRAICLSATDGFGERVKDLTPEGWLLAVTKAESLTKPGITVTGVTDDGRLKVKRS